MDSFRSGVNSSSAWRKEQLVCAADRANSTNCVVSNPSGWVDSDGTAWLNFVLRGAHEHGGRGGYGFGLAKAPSWKGPYTPLTGFWDAPVLPSNGTAKRNCEDSVLWRDSRGGLHMLFHYTGLSDDHGDHGGHAHASASGQDWAFSAGHAFERDVGFTGASPPPNASYSARQRPHVLLSAAGDITHLLTGVKFDMQRPFPAAECKRGGRGPCDHSWTSLQPVKTKRQ